MLPGSLDLGLGFPEEQGRVQWKLGRFPKGPNGDTADIQEQVRIHSESCRHRYLTSHVPREKQRPRVTLPAARGGDSNGLHLIQTL